MTLAAVTAYAFSGGDTVASAGGALAGVGTVALVAGLVLRFPIAVPWAVMFAGAGYVVSRAHHSVVDGWAAVVGGALLLAAELAAWSLASDRRIHEERLVVVRQSLTVAALVVSAALVSFVLVGAAAVSATAGLLLTAVGVVAAVGAVAVILRLAR
ncbi:MAG TPA: hypothetical protein VLJ44_00325 [Gaiellaceae bacterium]|nr:hypothetical protein [Gaiellaceae bacterium]